MIYFREKILIWTRNDISSRFLDKQKFLICVCMHMCKENENFLFINKY